MSKYSGKKYLFPVSLDEVGINASIIRLEDESLDSYRRRVNLQVKDFPTPDKESLLSSCNRTVGLFEKALAKITLVKDSEGIPIAEDPRIEIQATSISIWSNWNNGKNAPELKALISTREGSYFLKDLIPLISALPFLEVETLEEYEDFLKTSNLKVCNTNSVSNDIKLSSSRLNKLWVGRFSKAYFTNQNSFSNEVFSIEAMKDEGDYFINYERGYIYSYSIASGSVSVDYSDFPHLLTWQPVKAIEINDDTLKELTRDIVIDDDGGAKRLLLNSYGVSIANKILKVSPINWGE